MEVFLRRPLRSRLVLAFALLSWTLPLRGLGVAAAPTAPPHLGLDQAIALALTLDPGIDVAESRVTGARGALLGARGDFDPLLTGGITREDETLPGGLESEALSTSFGWSQLLRSGLALAPAIDLVRTDAGGPVADQAVVSFGFRQPLLAGRGRRATAARERSAERLVEAERLDLEQTVAVRLRSVIAQYWTATAARYDLEILRATEESSRRLLETTRRLIEADVTPAAEAVLLEADLAAKESDRISGERFAYQARIDLGREIGLPPEEIVELPAPSDPLPEVSEREVPPASAAGPLTQRALAGRADLAAARSRLAAAEDLLAAAENALQPRFDLVFVPSYTSEVAGGGTGDFFRPLVDEIPGLSTRLGFDLSWPTLNRGAEGALLQAGAAREQGRLAIDLVANQIGADVPIALDAARRIAERVGIAERAVRLFEQAVENEEKKLRAGSSTLIDVLSQRDRLTASRRQLVSARLDLALAVLELRFQTGTLVAAEGDRYAVRVEDVTAFPEHSL